VGFVNNNVSEVMSTAPTYQTKFQYFIDDLNRRFNLDEKISVNQLFVWTNISTIATTVAGIVTTIAGFMSLIIIYVIFLLLEYHTFNWKIQALFPDDKNRKAAENLIAKINIDVKTYIKIKTFVSLLTALACYGVLIIMGIQFAGFWAVLVFVLNYIPNVGSLVAVALPVLFAIVQFNLGHALLLSIFLVAIQFTIGNILEPRFMGKSLNLSPLVIIVSLVVWGSIWGIVGMFLCVPIMVILNIILAKFDSTRPIAILLSSKGELL
jgi:predicted PurR-regulated permease PerM